MMNKKPKFVVTASSLTRYYEPVTFNTKAEAKKFIKEQKLKNDSFLVKWTISKLYPELVMYPEFSPEASLCPYKVIRDDGYLDYEVAMCFLTKKAAKTYAKNQNNYQNTFKKHYKVVKNEKH